MTEEATDELLGPYAVFEVEYLKRPGGPIPIVAEVRRVPNAASGTLVRNESGTYNLQDISRPEPGPDVLPTLVASEDIHRVFQSDGSDEFVIGQVVVVVD